MYFFRFSEKIFGNPIILFIFATDLAEQLKRGDGKSPLLFAFRRPKQNIQMKTEDIKAIAEPILESRNLFLVDLKISKDNVIELFADSLQGVDIRTCIEVSREIESHLNRDEEDFELTVSSAGIGYPFKVEGQYRKNLGKTVEIKLTDNSRHSGTLKAFDAETLTVEYEEKKAVEGKKKKETVRTERTLPRRDIKEIKDIVSF